MGIKITTLETFLPVITEKFLRKIIEQIYLSTRQIECDIEDIEDNNKCMNHQKTSIETPKTNHQPWWEVFDGFNVLPRLPVPSRFKELEASERIIE